MIRILSTIILFIALTGCSATVGEWNHGTKAKGYRAHDVCWICGEQIKFFPNEEYGLSKELYESNFYHDPNAVISY
tara:strand:+ start:132 stop:359 length:228 start_codon:yes stop_codon:yes gene_type:complete